MAMERKFLASVVALALGTTAAYAEGIERVNLDTSFMYESGTYAELSFGRVNPSIPADWAGGSSESVAKGFSVSNFAAKTSIGDNIDLGIWSTNNSSGAAIDWGPTIPIKADLTVSALTGLIRYSLSDNLSIMAGVKSLKSNAATLSLPIAVGTVASYSVPSANTSVTVYGAAYEQPEIALRIEVLAESEGELGATTNYAINGNPAGDGAAKVGIGDAVTVNFQTGIAANTLLFGSIRNSKWANNQVEVPLAGAVSTFGDGQSYTVGIGRKFSDSVSGSISTFYDPASGCDDASALSPTCENRSVSLGAKIALSEDMNLSLGTTWSRRGTASVTSLGASTSKSVVTSLGAKLSYNF